MWTCNGGEKPAAARCSSSASPPPVDAESATIRISEPANQFLTDGYAATTIAAIAAEADVAVQTVYSRFGTKAAIVKELLDVSIAGDEEPVPVADRPWYRRVYDEGITGHERLRRYAHTARRVLEGADGAFEIIRRGADGDPELVELWVANRQARRGVVSKVLDAGLADAVLRPGLERDEAIDLLWLLHGPEVFHHLTVDCGWSADRYERWLADAMCEQVLGAEEG